MPLPPHIVSLEDRRTSTRELISGGLLEGLARDELFCQMVSRYRMQFSNGYEALAQLEERRIWKYMREHLDAEFMEPAFTQLQNTIHEHREHVGMRVRAQAPAEKPQSLDALLRTSNLDGFMNNAKFKEAAKNYCKAVHWGQDKNAAKWRDKLWTMLHGQVAEGLEDRLLDQLKEMAAAKTSALSR